MHELKIIFELDYFKKKPSSGRLPLNIVLR